MGYYTVTLETSLDNLAHLDRDDLEKLVHSLMGMVSCSPEIHPYSVRE